MLELIASGAEFPLVFGLVKLDLVFGVALVFGRGALTELALELLLPELLLLLLLSESLSLSSELE